MPAIHAANPNSPAKVGLIAGWGRFPVVVAESLAAQGCEVYCLGIKDHADPVLRSICHDYEPLGIARLGQAVRYFHRHGVERATMAGKIHKVLLFQKWYWLKHFPDWEFVRTFYPHFITQTQDRKDDTMLGTFVNAFGRRGVRCVPATELVPGLLVAEGQLTGSPLTFGQRQDVAFGWQLAREIGRLDVGQSVAVKGRAVLAVEAVEGTDECIRRAGKLCPLGGFTVVKVAKPQQDMRFDVPTIGEGTLRTMAEAGGKVLAVEADRTILIDQPAFVQVAQRLGITVVALRHAQLAQEPAAA